MKIKFENISNLHHPEVPYEKKQQIKLFNSFAAMNDADAKEMAELSPKEHLQNAVLLIQKIFSEELKKPMDKKIKF